MAVEANLVSAGRRYRVRTPEERERAFSNAGRHSRIVHCLRKGLPILAVVVLTSYFISTRLNVTVGDVTASVDGMEVTDGNLRMLNPTVKGSDKKSGKYVVNAEYADQDVKNPKIVKLHAIKADLSSPGGGWSRMKAIRGIFDSSSERLVMQDRITVESSSGATGELEHATLDMETQTLRSHRPVSFNLTNGTVRANALTLRSSEKILIFRGKVAVHLDKQPKPGEGAPQGSSVPQPMQGSQPAVTGSTQTVNPQ